MVVWFGFRVQILVLWLLFEKLPASYLAVLFFPWLSNQAHEDVLLFNLVVLQKGIVLQHTYGCPVKSYVTAAVEFCDAE